jgi:uncharacterized Zn finger protein
MSWGRRRNDYWGGWPRYVPVSERKEKARKQAEKLRKKGDSLAPVVIAGRTIASTFWGKAWCQNLEQYGDYENRIPRGRAYVRNGSVIDLKIGTARVDALVSGSHLYSVAVEIRPLNAQVWKGAKKACTGRIGSLLELLQGKLSREVMEIVTKPQTGLFPEPAEISFRCSCPDWASMCKHVAAVLYGVGARLDREPELLFRLRDVDHRELIVAPAAADLAASPGMGDKMIAEEDLAGIFGIEIDEKPTVLSTVPETAKRGGRGEKSRTAATEPAAPMRARAPHSAASGTTIEPAKTRRTLRPKPQEAAAPPEPLKRKRGRPGLTPESNVPPTPLRERGHRVRKEILLPQERQNPFAGVEKLLLRRNYSPVPESRSETPEPARSRRGRPPKAAVSEVTLNPPKRKPGRPRVTPQTGAEEQAAQSPAEPKRERPKSRPAFLRALREEAARKRREIKEEAVSHRGKTVSGKNAAPAPAPVSLPTRRGGQPSRKRKTT